MLDFQRRISLLLLFLGALLLSMRWFDKDRGMPAVFVAGLGILVFYAGLYVMLRRRV
jgi:hypothetical protein